MAKETPHQTGQRPQNQLGLSRPNHPTNRKQRADTAPREQVLADDDKEAAVAHTFLQKVVSVERCWKPRTSLRGALLVADAVAITCVGLVIDRRRPTNQDLRFKTLYFVFDNGGLTYSLVPLGVSILWCTFVSCMLFLHRPPRAGLELILFVLLLVAIIFSSIGMTRLAKFYYYEGDINDEYILQDVARRWKLQISIITMQALAMLLHLVLFFWDCFNMAERNKRKSTRISRDMQQKLRSYGPAAKGKQPVEILADVRQPAELVQQFAPKLPPLEAQTNLQQYVLSANLPTTGGTISDNLVKEGPSVFALQESRKEHPHEKKSDKGKGKEFETYRYA